MGVYGNGAGNDFWGAATSALSGGARSVSGSALGGHSNDVPVADVNKALGVVNYNYGDDDNPDAQRQQQEAFDAYPNQAALLKARKMAADMDKAEADSQNAQNTADESNLKAQDAQINMGLGYLSMAETSNDSRRQAMYLRKASENLPNGISVDGVYHASDLPQDADTQAKLQAMNPNHDNNGVYLHTTDQITGQGSFLFVPSDQVKPTIDQFIKELSAFKDPQQRAKIRADMQQKVAQKNVELASSGDPIIDATQTDAEGNPMVTGIRYSRLEPDDSGINFRPMDQTYMFTDADGNPTPRPISQYADAWKDYQAAQNEVAKGETEEARALAERARANASNASAAHSMAEANLTNNYKTKTEAARAQAESALADDRKATADYTRTAKTALTGAQTDKTQAQTDKLKSGSGPDDLKGAKQNLDTLLMPFKTASTSTWDPKTGAISMGGQSALQEAQKFIDQNPNGEPSDPAQAERYRQAKQAVDAWKNVSGRIANKYQGGGALSPQAQGSGQAGGQPPAPPQAASQRPQASAPNQDALKTEFINLMQQNGGNRAKAQVEMIRRHPELSGR